MLIGHSTLLFLSNSVKAVHKGKLRSEEQNFSLNDFTRCIVFIIKLIQMGQENSLNCRNNHKDKEQQIETTHSNPMNYCKTQPLQQEPQPIQSDIKSNKSATTVLSQIENKIPSLIRKPNSKKLQSYIPQHQNLLKVAYNQFEGSEKMGAKWVEAGGTCLADVMQGRYNTTMYFPQTQIVALIESLVYALAYLQKGAIKHHDFYPINIYYSNNLFKLANPLSIQFSAYTLTQQRRRFSYLSPELIAHILEDTPQDDIPPQMMFKADIFAIGMVVLECCTLQASGECYDEQNYQLIDQVIKERLVKVAQLYSPMIADCIAQMLVYNVEDRVNVQDLALLVYLNSSSEKIEKVPQQPAKISARGGTLPPLPKPSSSSVRQNNPQQAQQNTVNMQQHPHLKNPPQVQQIAVPISPNNIVMPPPNYTYSHIGPNNQSLLSTSSLQNKLKVIQQIRQTSQFQEESDGQLSSLPSTFGPGSSQLQQLRTQHQPQRIIVNSPFPPNQQQFIQQMPAQYVAQSNQFPHQMGPLIRQIMLPPGHQQPQQFIPHNLPPNMIRNMPGNVVQGHMMPPMNMVQQNRVLPPPSHVVQNLPQSGMRSTQIQSKYEPNSSRYEEQSRYRPSQTQLLSPYEGATNQSSYSNYGQKQSYTAQKDYDLLNRPTYKQSLQLNTQFQSMQPQSYRSNTYQSYNQPTYKPGNYSTNKYNTELDYLSTKSIGKYEPTNQYQGTSQTSNYSSTSLANKYARPRDQNGQTLQQRVDRILKMSKGIK